MPHISRSAVLDGCLHCRELPPGRHGGIKDGIDKLKINRALSCERNDLLIEAPAEPCRRSLGAFCDASQRIVKFCAALKFSDIARPLIDCLAAFVRRRYALTVMMSESAAASGRANSL